jgi:predicted anti-sigma-YlaC factor YlaD
MKCSDAHELMGDYLEGALAPEDRERHREHLECCADCRELLEDFEDIARQARELPRVEPSDAAWPAILRRVREARSEAAVPSTPRKKWFEAIFAPGRMVYAGASALLVLAVVGGLVLARRPSRTSARSTRRSRPVRRPSRRRRETSRRGSISSGRTRTRSNSSTT